MILSVPHWLRAILNYLYLSYWVSFPYSQFSNLDADPIANLTLSSKHPPSSTSSTDIVLLLFYGVFGPVFISAILPAVPFKLPCNCSRCLFSPPIHLTISKSIVPSRFFLGLCAKNLLVTIYLVYFQMIGCILHYNVCTWVFIKVLTSFLYFSWIVCQESIGHHLFGPFPDVVRLYFAL
jgi:hypothetical protein